MIVIHLVAGLGGYRPQTPCVGPDRKRFKRGKKSRCIVINARNRRAPSSRLSRQHRIGPACMEEHDITFTDRNVLRFHGCRHLVTGKRLTGAQVLNAEVLGHVDENASGHHWRDLTDI
ncbi:MAG: Uncharacterised protein [Halieaceae bacterium]|nr:MAG: Uncharacterised protein [Halieaceae bacterium]